MKSKTRLMVSELVGVTRALATIAECKMVAVEECAASARRLADDVLEALNNEPIVMK